MAFALLSPVTSQFPLFIFYFILFYFIFSQFPFNISFSGHGDMLFSQKTSCSEEGTRPEIPRTDQHIGGILGNELGFFWGGVFVYFSRATPQHMEVPRLGVQLELQLPVYTTATATQDLICVCDLHQSPRQCWVLNPLSGARDQTHIFMDTGCVHYCCPTTRTPFKIFFKITVDLQCCANFCCTA